MAACECCKEAAAALAAAFRMELGRASTDVRVSINGREVQSSSTGHSAQSITRTFPSVDEDQG